MITVGQMVKQFGLARSTLLYYDSIGLLKPSKRSRSGYRLYSETDIRRMEQVQTFRKAGLALEDIRLLLDSQAGAFNAILEKRLEKIDETMSNLRNQQKVIVALLKKKTKMITTRSMNEEQWEGLLKASGFDEAGMRKWHVEFERMSPQAHQDFLESLGIEEEELNQIRRKSREVWPLADGE